MADNKKILVGKIVAPQGIRGEVRVNTYTANPTDMRDLRVMSPQFAGGAFHFVRAVPASAVIIARIDGVNDRNAAELLRGAELFINRDDLPQPAPGEYYHADLIGVPVVRDGVQVGVVDNIQNYGGGDILELDNGDLIAFNRVDVDLENKTIYIRD